MALVSKTGVRTDVPHEPGEWMQLRQLSGAEVELARTQRQSTVLGQLAQHGKQLAEVMALFESEGARPQVSLVDELDHDVVLRAGILAWSYDAPVSNETIADLDAETRTWAVAAILRPHQRGDAERLADFLPSTAS